MEPYQLTRTIRFKLLGTAENKDIQRKIDDVKEGKRDLRNNLINLLQEASLFSRQLKQVLVDDIEQDSIRFRSKCPEVRYGWLKQYTKTQYYQLIEEKKQKTYELTKLKLNGVNFLELEMTRWFQEWTQTLEILDGEVEKYGQKEYEFSRRSVLAMLIRKLSKRDMYPFISDFIAMTDSKLEHLSEIIKKIGQLLEKCEYGLLPTQSGRLSIARASFNYYVISKKPVTEKKKQTVQPELENKEIIAIALKHIFDTYIDIYKEAVINCMKNKNKKVNMNNLIKEITSKLQNTEKTFKEIRSVIKDKIDAENSYLEKKEKRVI